MSERLSRDQILEIVTRRISELFFVKRIDIDEQSRFDEDLPTDRTNFGDLLDVLEDDFLNQRLSFSLRSTEVHHVETVADLVDMIMREVIAIVGIDTQEKT